MKKIIQSLLVVLAVALSPLATAGFFGAEKTLSDPSVGSQFPTVAYYNNIIHVVWVGYPGGVGEIFYARSTDNGSTFSAPVNLSATPGVSEDRPQITAGPQGVFAAWNTDNNTGSILARKSGDGGLNWAPAATLAGIEGDVYYSRLTSLFTDSRGRVHLGYYDNTATNGEAGMVYHRMSCDGTNWGAPTAVTVKAIDGDVDNEEPRFGEAAGRMYVTFRSSRLGNPQGGWPPYSIHLQTGSLNCGTATSTWSYPARRIAAGNPLSYASTYRPEVFGEATGMLHLAWWDLSQGANVHYRRGVPATSGTFSAPVNLSNFGVDHREPGGIASTAAQTQGGYSASPGLVSNGTNAVIVYQQNADKTVTNLEFGPVLLRDSADNGGTWAGALPVATTNQGSIPRVALGGAGNQNVAIVWTDMRGDGTAKIMFRMYNLGAASGPSFSVSSSALGSRPVGAAVPVTLTVVNSGLAGTINGITITGDATRTGGTCVTGAVGAGGSCTIALSFTPAALGARTATVTVSSNAPDSPAVGQVTATGVASGNIDANSDAVVTGYYETILGRSPDPGAVPFWTGEANRVANLGADRREAFYALAIQFFNSAEYIAKGRNNTQYITDLYRTFFIREPDQVGLDYWVAQLDAGMDRGAMLNNFLFSPEFVNFMTALFGSPAIRPEVNMTMDLFRGSFGRLPDSGGFTYWLGRVRAAQCQGAAAVVAEMNDISALFLTSPEYGARDTARAPALRIPMHVGDLYNLFLRRGGDLTGYQYWVNELATGARTRDNVRIAFVNSPEFQARVNAVIAAGCAP